MKPQPKEESQMVNQQLKETERALEDAHGMLDKIRDAMGGGPYDTIPVRIKNLAERCERLEAALRDMVDRITYYAELKDAGAPNIEDWAYTYHSGDMKRAREALSSGAAT